MGFLMMPCNIQTNNNKSDPIIFHSQQKNCEVQGILARDLESNEAV